MNDTFNLKRFGWVFRKFLWERPAQILGLLGLALAISLLTYAIMHTSIGIGKAQGMAFTFGIISGISFMASAVFGYFGSNASGSSFLMLPASHFEKWLCGILFTGVLFTCVYLGFFRLIDIFFVNGYRNSLDPHSFNYQELYHSVEIFPFNSAMAKTIYMLVVNVAGAMLVGSLYFNKVSFIKVALLICALIACIHLFNQLIASFFFSNIDMAVPYQGIFLKVGKEVGRIDMPTHIDNIIMAAIYYVIPAILWITAYIRLVEKEI